MTTPTKDFVIERSVFAKADAGRVRALIAAPGTWPEWQPEILRTSGPEELEVGAVVDGRAAMLGFEVDGKNVTTELTEERIGHDAVVGVGLQIVYELVPEAGGVRITHRLSSNLPGGGLGRLLSFFLRRRLKKMQREVLANLVAQAEGSSA